MLRPAAKRQKTSSATPSSASIGLQGVSDYFDKMGILPIKPVVEQCRRRFIFSIDQSPGTQKLHHLELQLLFELSRVSPQHDTKRNEHRNAALSPITNTVLNEIVKTAASENPVPGNGGNTSYRRRPEADRCSGFQVPEMTGSLCVTPARPIPTRPTPTQWSPAASTLRRRRRG